MTQDETRQAIAKLVVDFTKEYIEKRILWQSSQIAAGAEPDPALFAALDHLYSDPPAEALHHMMEPQEWLTMALYGAGAIEADPGEIREICQSLAEWLFGIPGAYHYEIPAYFHQTPLGALWWRALIKTEGDDLITIGAAAKLSGRSVQAISSRIDRGRLDSYTDPLAPDRQGRRLVRRSEIEALGSGMSRSTTQTINPKG